MPDREHRHGRKMQQKTPFVEDEVIGISSTQADLRLREPIEKHPTLRARINFFLSHEELQLVTVDGGGRMPIVQDGQPRPAALLLDDRVRHGSREREALASENIVEIAQHQPMPAILRPDLVSFLDAIQLDVECAAECRGFVDARLQSIALPVGAERPFRVAMLRKVLRIAQTPASIGDACRKQGRHPRVQPARNGRRAQLSHTLVVGQVGIRSRQIDVAIADKAFLRQMQIGRVTPLDVSAVHPVLQGSPEAIGLRLRSRSRQEDKQQQTKVEHS